MALLTHSEIGSGWGRPNRKNGVSMWYLLDILHENHVMFLWSEEYF